jgi:hypothetical protein
MFAILDNLEIELKKEVKKIENKWDKEPRKDYYFHEICGINKAIDVVDKFKSKELLELDKWAQNYTNNQGEGDTLSD